MDKALIDIEVINGIIKAYNRTKNQTRIFGIILGTKKDKIYHISDIIYGFIFEEGEDQKTQKKNYVRLNEDNFNSILNSYSNKFNLLSQQKINEKVSKEKEITFRSNDNLMILGGFATDKDLFSDLHSLYSTIQQINNNTFKLVNSLILLVDPNHKEDKVLKYGVKTYLWEIKNIKIKNEVNRLLTFKEIENDIIENLNTVHLLNTIFNDKINPELKLFNIDIDKNDKKPINELLFSAEDKNKEEINGNDYEKNNLLYIKNKIKQSLDFLEIIEKFLEEKANKKSEGAEADNEAEILDKISNIVSKLEPILENEEMINVLSNGFNKNENISSLTQLLQVQLNLSEKIHRLIN